MKISIILPTYNEAENIEKIIPQIHETLKKYEHEIIVVDDDSPDLTWEKAASMRDKGIPVKVILRSNTMKIKGDGITTIPLNKRSLSAAVIEGFKRAEGDVIVVMDADGQHPPELIPKLIDEIKRGCDLAIGSRYMPGSKIERWSLYRKIVSKTFTIIAKIILPEIRKITDVNAGFFAVKKEVIERSVDEYDGYGFKILWEVIVKGQPDRICETPIIFRNRLAGKSKANPKIAWEGFKNLIKLRKYKNQKISKNSSPTSSRA